MHDVTAREKRIKMNRKYQCAIFTCSQCVTFFKSVSLWQLSISSPASLQLLPAPGGTKGFGGEVRGRKKETK